MKPGAACGSAHRVGRCCSDYAATARTALIGDNGALHARRLTDSIVSLQYVMEDDVSAEISVVGNEGLIGIALTLGGEPTPSRAVVRSTGDAYRLTGAQVKEEFARNGEMQLLPLRYTQALLTQMAQTAVCKRFHSLDQQLCRWLLPISRSPVFPPADHDPGIHCDYARRTP
jgi:hypothetical protein